MSINNRFKMQLLKASLIYGIILMGEFKSCSAQALKRFARDYQLGLEASFGVKSFTLSSDIVAIDGLSVMEEGGSIGFIAGAKSLRLKVSQGYYYSSSAVAHTVDEVRLSGALNFYPLQFFMKRNSAFQPYLMGSLERNILKMYGFYASGSDSKPRNYSVSEAPYLGKIATLYASLGGGMEYRIRKPGYFVNLFGEAKYGKPVSALSTSSLFEGTKVSNQLMVNFGVAFGYCR